MQTARLQAILFLFLGLSFSGCWLITSSPGNGDYFYTATRNGDLYRIPLVKPHELVSPDESTWFLALPFPIDSLLGKDEIDVIQFGMHDSVIVATTELLDFTNVNDVAQWIVIDARKDAMHVFLQRKAYIDFMERAFHFVPELYQPNDIYGGFRDFGDLPF